MSFLLEMDTCQAHLLKKRLVNARVGLNRGMLHVSVVTVAELGMWLLHPKTPSLYLQGYGAFIGDVKVIEVDEDIAYRAASLGSKLALQNQRMNTADLLIAATALVRDWTLVSHDILFYSKIPGLKLADWLVP